MSTARYDRLAQAHHDVNTGPVTTTAEQQAKVRVLIADQPDAELLAAILGLNQPAPEPVGGVHHSARHYHGTTIPLANRVGRMS